MRRGTEEVGSSYARELAHESWGQTESRPARTRNARHAAEQAWLDKAGGDHKKAESLRKAHYARMARKSAEARASKRKARSS